MRRLRLLPRAAGNQSEAAIRRDSFYRRALAVADTGAAAATLLITMFLVGPSHPEPWALLTVPLIVLLGKILGVYDRRESLVRKSTLDEAPILFQVATLYVLAVWLINGFLITRSSDRRELLVEWMTLSVLILVCRAVAGEVSRKLTTAERCLVVGDGPTCNRIRVKLASRASLHAEVVTHVPTTDLASERENLDILSKKGDLQALTTEYRVDRVIIAPELADADEVLNVIRAANSLGVKVSVVPRLLEVVGSSVEFDEIEGVPLLSMRKVGLSRSSRLIKRALDVTVSVAALVLLAPLLAAIAAAIKLDSHGPILFRQLRVGRDGDTFEMLKFRSMVRDADAKRAELLHLNESEGLFKISEDPRITRVGTWLRKLSLDELPQLWNVLTGDMSLVGPRPLIAEEDRRVEGWHRRRLQLTPGMTGHWQILGSARVPLHEMVNIDYLYVTNWSLWNDIKTLLRTVPFVVGRKGM